MPPALLRFASKTCVEATSAHCPSQKRTAHAPRQASNTIERVRCALDMIAAALRVDKVERGRRGPTRRVPLHLGAHVAASGSWRKQADIYILISASEGSDSMLAVLESACSVERLSGAAFT